MSGSSASSSNINTANPSANNNLEWGYNSSWPPVDQFTQRQQGQVSVPYNAVYDTATNSWGGTGGDSMAYAYGNGANTSPNGGLGTLYSNPGTTNFQLGNNLIEQWDPYGTNAFGAQLYASGGLLPPGAPTNGSQSYDQFMQQFRMNPAEQVAIQQGGEQTLGGAVYTSPNNWAASYYDPMGYLSPGYDPATNSLGGNLQQQLGIANWSQSMPASFNAPPTPPDPNAQWTAQNTTSNGMQNTTWGTTDPYNNQWFIGPAGSPWFLPGGDPNAAMVNSQVNAIGQATQQSVLGGGLPTSTKGGGAAPSVQNPLLNLSYNPQTGSYYFPTGGYNVTDPGYSYMPGSGQTVAAGTPGATTIPASVSNVYLANDPSQPGQPVAGPGGSYQTGGQTIDPALLYRARLAAGIQDNGPNTAQPMPNPMYPQIPGNTHYPSNSL